MDTQTVSYTIKGVNMEKKEAKVLVVSNDGQKATITASLSALLMHMIKQGMENSENRQYVGVTYTSTIDSPSFDENPLKVVRFNHKDGTFKNWHLKLVHEKGYDPVYDIFGRKVKRIYKYFKKSEFIRYASYSV